MNNSQPLLVIAVFVVVSAGCEIRPLDPVTGKAIIEEAEQAFDASSFVEENWEERIVPTIEQDAIDLSMLLTALGEDREAASSTYGYREGEGPFNFIVTGSGRVVGVDTTSRAGVLRVNLSGHSTEVLLQIGPVIRGTSLRDALPFISFNQFVNQLEYARVSNELHARLVETVLSGVDYSALLNQDIRFSGVFTLRETDQVLITPVEIQLENIS